MSLVDKLLAIDKGIYAQNRTGTYKAKRMSEVMKEDVMIVLKALEAERYTAISTGLIGSDGEADYSKVYDNYLLLCVEGIKEPSMKDPELQKHFGVATPKELVKVLFPGAEVSEIANEITELSGFANGNRRQQESEVKN